MPDPELLTRYVGTGVALIGAFLVSPGGTKQLAHQAVTRAKRLDRAARERLKRVIPWVPWRRTTPIPAPRGGSTATATAVFVARGKGYGWEPDATLVRKVERLREHVEQLRDELNERASQLGRRIDHVQHQLTEVDQRLTQAVDALGERQHKIESDKALVDARALPIVGVGLMLSTVPDLFAWLLPRWLLYIVLAGALVLAAGTAVRAYTERRMLSDSSPLLG